MATPSPIEPYTPTSEAITLASQALESISALGENPNDTITFAILDPAMQDTRITIPSGMFQLMVNILQSVSRGEPVTILPHSAELTTQEAADILRVSRPYLVKLLDEGTIPSRKVGIYRRVQLQDLLHYQKTEKQRQFAVMEELTKEAQDTGLYDLP
ncbi:MAG: helix-turn-helix domain-containing protein [Scytonematopsis contorta HA4267-MV1]|jgi:excisionase family DNA binding protein|nr:helix-turn-helix domain-containing protein [Scytonematopsis contorta HA4267-MV1]